MAAPAKQMENLRLHLPDISAIAKAGTGRRNALLQQASPGLVEALATAIRVLEENDVTFAPYHERRAHRMMSKNTAKRTKLALVRGTEGSSGSRGGPFFKDVCKTLMTMVPDLFPDAVDESGGGMFSGFASDWRDGGVFG